MPHTVQLAQEESSMGVASQPIELPPRLGPSVPE
jgi:hypothetical protein